MSYAACKILHAVWKIACKILHAPACKFVLSARNARVNCVQYGVFTRMLRSCNAAIPVSCTVAYMQAHHSITVLLALTLVHHVKRFLICVTINVELFRNHSQRTLKYSVVKSKHTTRLYYSSIPSAVSKHFLSGVWSFRLQEPYLNSLLVVFVQFESLTNLLSGVNLKIVKNLTVKAY